MSDSYIENCTVIPPFGKCFRFVLYIPKVKSALQTIFDGAFSSVAFGLTGDEGRVVVGEGAFNDRRFTGLYGPYTASVDRFDLIPDGAKIGLHGGGGFSLAIIAGERDITDDTIGVDFETGRTDMRDIHLRQTSFSYHL